MSEQRRWWGFLAFVMLTVGTLAHAVGQESEKPILQLETGGHTALCRWVDFTRDGQSLVSVGDDKVIRIWSLTDRTSDGELQPRLDRSIRLQIGPGDEGKIFAADISPDGRWLAVGGYGTPNTKAHWGDIHVIDLRSGEVRSVLRGHSSVVNGLAFSPDGEFLASGSGDDTLRVWPMQSLQSSVHDNAGVEIKGVPLEGHTDDVYGLAWLPDAKSGRYRLVSGSKDNTARLWQRSADGSWRSIQTIKGHKHDVMQVACSADGRWIATSSKDRSVRLWNADGQSEKVLGVKSGSFQMTPKIDFSPDSQRLVAADRKQQGGSVVWSVPDGEQISRFDGHDNTVYSARFASPIVLEGLPHKSLIASTGGNSKEIFLWDADTGKQAAHIVGRGGSVFAAAFSPDGRQIAWGWTNSGNPLKSNKPLTTAFDLQTFAPAEIAPASGMNWQRGRLTSDGYSASADSKRINTLVVKRPDGKVVRISRRQSYDRIRCYAFLPGKRQVVVGSYFGLTLHDADSGKQLQEFTGHTGDIWAVAVSPDGRTLLSASSDQTLRLWDLESTDQDVVPMLNCFFTKDGKDHVVWTDEGYYSASPGGEDLIGWHTNRGVGKSANFAAAWQYSKVFNRPEIVELIPTARSTDKAIAMAAEILKTRPARKMDIATDQAELAVPKIIIKSPQSSSHVDHDSVAVRGRVEPTGSLPIAELRVSVNGRPVMLRETQALMKRVADEGDEPRPVRFFLNVPLIPNGENRIEIIASTRTATTQPSIIEVTSDIRSFTKPKLYVLGVGVSDYEDKAMFLNFPDDDVQGVVDALKQQNKRYYEDVVVDVLLNEKVTDRGLRRSVKKLRENVTQFDVAIVMVAGHGYAAADGTYYFCPHDFDQEDPEITGIPYDVLTEPLKDLPCKVILCMDTCHAAGVLGPAKERGLQARGSLSALERTITDMASLDSGVVVLTSSTGREPSFEDPRWGHGAFSLALIEALTGKPQLKDSSRVKLPADTNGDRFLELSEIDAYITARVRELTRGKQHPVTERGRMPSFTFAVAK